MKNSIASLKERLSDWTDWDRAAYELGACLGFCVDFGAPHDQDLWNGVKSVIRSRNALSDALIEFLGSLTVAGVLEMRDNPDIAYRWNPNYEGKANGP